MYMMYNMYRYVILNNTIPPIFARIHPSFCVLVFIHARLLSFYTESCELLGLNRAEPYFKFECFPHSAIGGQHFSLRLYGRLSGLRSLAILHWMSL